jgi:hypothetical protein
MYSKIARMIRRISYSDFELELHEEYNSSFKYVIPIKWTVGIQSICDLGNE